MPKRHPYPKRIELSHTSVATQFARPADLCRLSLARLQCVQAHRFENQRLQRGRIESVTFVEVDGAN
jgi:hypothetical protein